MLPVRLSPRRQSALPRLLARFAALAFAALSLCVPGAAAAATSLDASYKPVFATPASVEGVIALPNGQALVYGEIASMNGAPANGIARLNADGTLDTGFQLTTVLQVERIFAAAAQADGRILIGGYITWYGTTSMRRYLFRLNADGSWDTSFDAGGYDFGTSSSYGLDAAVRAILVQPDGRIVVGGDFSQPYGHVARLLATGAVDTTFNPGAGADAAVLRIARQSTGHLVIGGDFTTVAGTAKARIARLSSTGALDTAAFGNGIVGGALHALAVQADDRILAGGSFTAAGGQDATRMARFSAAGVVEPAFSPVARTYLHEVTSLLAMGDRIFAGGWNPRVIFNGSPTDHDAEVYAMSAADGSFVGYVSFEGDPTDVWGLAARPDGGVLAVGSFIKRDDPFDAGLYAGIVLLAGEYFQPVGAFRPQAGGLPDVRALALQADGRMVAGGGFYLVDGVRRNGIARLNADGSLDTTFAPSSSGSGKTNALAVRGDGKVVAGGTVYNAATQTWSDIALLDASGAVEATASAGMVTSLAASPGNKVVAGLYHSPGVMRFDASLAAEGTSTFNPGSGISNSQQPDLEFDRVNAVAVQADGKILVAGSFYSFSGQARQNIVRLNADGTLDAGFTSPAFSVFTFRTEIFAVAVQPDGKILLAGRFSTVGGAARPTLARLNADGTVDTGFVTPLIDQGSTAYALFVQPDGRILAGGNLQVLEGSAIYNSVARFMPGGARDTSFGHSAYGVVKALQASALPAGGGIQVFAGGSFQAVDGSPRIGMARMTGASAVRGDLDGDGKSDLLYRNFSTGQVWRFLMNGPTPDAGAMAFVEPNLDWQVVADADFNGDGVTDLLWRNASNGMFYWMPFGSSGMPIGGAVIYTEPAPAWKLVHTPDLDGNGTADLLWWNSSTGQVYAMLLNGASIGAQGLVYTEPNTAWKIAAVGDFAGSGKTNQLLWRNSTTGQVYLMTVTVSGGVFSQTGQMIYQEANTAWKILAAADFNGDGKSDLLWRNESTGMVYGMLMNGASIAGEAVVYTEPNPAWKIVAQGDYDGNGKADLLWRNDTTGMVYLMLMNGLTIASQGVVFTEPNTAWRILGPWEYGQANGLMADGAASGKSGPSTLKGEPLNRGMIGGWPVNSSPGIGQAPANAAGGHRLPHRRGTDKVLLVGLPLIQINGIRPRGQRLEGGSAGAMPAR